MGHLGAVQAGKGAETLQLTKTNGDIITGAGQTAAGTRMII